MAETERLRVSSEIFIINATSLSIDVYVNSIASPAISDPKSAVQSPTKDEYNAPAFVVKDDHATPYGVYTFSVRLKGYPDSELLGEASADMQQGRSYTGVFHEMDPGAFQFSVYENDLSDGDLARLTVIHAARAPQVEWAIRPNGEDPRIPADYRFGALARGEWQVARNITDNDYVIEFTIDGQVVARNPDLDLARAKNFVVLLIGDPAPASNAQVLLRPILYQELEFDSGPAEPSGVSPAAPPLSSSDQNAPLQFSCEPVTIWQTSAATTLVSATDPDGKVLDLSIHEIIPEVDGIEIVAGSLRPALAIGAPASAVVSIKSDVPHGQYAVVVAANRGTMAQQAECPLALTVMPVTILRLAEVVETYRQSGQITTDAADALDAILSAAQQRLDSGDISAGCGYLKDFLSLIGTHKGKAVSDAAHDQLEREAKALRTDLQCG